ncbi:MAG: DUF1553 domain-containing protein [Verrucomicrobiales bacterium]|nr:DUF1553 domain-containing protein [Verrucomicrobiales bacterium]
MKPMSFHRLTTTVLILLAAASLATATPQHAAKLEFFETKIRPVLVEHCYECHSVESGKSKGDLFLDSRAAWQVGGESGPAIVPGNAEESLLIMAIDRSGVIPEMPPKSHLSDEVIEDFKQWIADGAVDPRKGDVPVHEKEEIDIEEGRKFWSFQPRRTFSERHTIDGFVDPQTPRAPAEKLVRRLFLDLIGLPPTTADRQAFLRLYDESPDRAVSTTVDQLLARNEFGEKWARHWLDVARYADSNGGDFNLTFVESWRYRNYVIDAFNRDMPYDQFLREQIAGDLLPFENAGQRDRQLIATGYLMIAPKMLTERNKAKMHLDIADEQVDTIGRSIMGLTLGCARCHDHKFDPIPTADYYAMTGILHSTRTADRILMNNVNVTGWTETALSIDDETRALMAAHQSKVEKLEKQIDEVKKSGQSDGVVVDDNEAELTGPWRRSTYRKNHVGDYYLSTDKGNGPYSITWKATLPKPGKYEVRVSFGGGPGLAKTASYFVTHAGGEERMIVDQTVRPTIGGMWYPIGQFTFGETAEVLLTDKDAGGYLIADAIQLVHIEDLESDSGTPDIKTLEAELKNLKGKAPEVPKAMAAADHTGGRCGNLQIRIRGEPGNKGKEVPRGFLQVASYSGSSEATIPDGESGRVQLADWLTHPDHPLTARVMVNRIWQQLFGRGIVATSDNFGILGAKPSHHELLDYLAGQFIENEWSVKALIREIAGSRTYQQAAKTATEDDPDNLRLRHQNRRPAPAETIRDSVLAIAGELDREPRESVVSQLGMYAIETSGKRHVSLGETGRLRQRSIYLPIVRGALPPSLAVFDLPNPDLVTGSRSITTVPAQALFMMNSPFVREMARATATRLTKERISNEEIIEQLYLEILVRDADTGDLAMGLEYIDELIEAGKSREEAIASFVQVLVSSTEFRFIE